MCEEQVEVSNDSIESPEIKPEVDCSEESPATISANKEATSRKFLAYIIAVSLGLIGFVVIYLNSKEGLLFSKYLDFLLWTLVTYIGGNSASKITDKLGAKWEK